MKRLGATLITALLAVAIAMAGPAAAEVTDVTGSGAFGESVSVKVLDLAPVTSGPLPTVDLPSSGGTEDKSLASVKVPANGSVLTTKVLTVHTEGTVGGHTDGSKSSAQVNSATVLDALAGEGGLPDEPLLTANLISSECTSNGDGSSGSSSLLNAKIFGQDPAINPDPNTTINVIPGLTVILNEQIVTNTPGVETKITVNAVHVIANVPDLVTGEIILSQSRCRAAGPDVLGGAPPGGPGGAGGPGAAGPAGPVSAAPRFTG